MSDSVRPQRRQPTRLPRPWDSSGKNTGAGCHCLLQCMKVKRESEVAQSCPTLSNPRDCSLPGPPSMEFPGKRTGVGCHCPLRLYTLQRVNYRKLSFHVSLYSWSPYPFHPSSLVPSGNHYSVLCMYVFIWSIHLFRFSFCFFLITVIIVFLLHYLCGFFHISFLKVKLMWFHLWFPHKLQNKDLFLDDLTSL